MCRGGFSRWIKPAPSWPKSPTASGWAWGSLLGLPSPRRPWAWEGLPVEWGLGHRGNGPALKSNAARPMHRATVRIRPTSVRSIRVEWMPASGGGGEGMWWWGPVGST